MTRIVSYKHFIDFKDSAQLAIENFLRDVRQIELDLVLAPHTEFFKTNLKDLAGRDVARDQVSIRGILFFEEIPAFVFRDL